MSGFHSQLRLEQLQKVRHVFRAFWQADFWQEFEQERLS